MSEENKALIRRWFEEVWNNGREEAIDEMLAADGVAHGLGEPGDVLRGAEGFRPLFHTFRGAFPDIHVTVEDTVAEGDKVAARCTVRGSHRGDHLGIAATDGPTEFSGICIVRVRDGQIVEAWNNFDFQTMYRQLGAHQAVPPPPADAYEGGGEGVKPKEA